MQDKKKKKKEKKKTHKKMKNKQTQKMKKKKNYNKMCVCEREREREPSCVGIGKAMYKMLDVRTRFESLAHKMTGLRPKKPKIMNLQRVGWKIGL